MNRPFIHDPAIYKDPVTGRYYVYATRGDGYVSDDLIHWESLGRIASVLPEVQAWTGGNDIWAPDIVKVGDEYRLYCSNSTWGVQQSCIFLAVSDRAEGPFIPRASVLKTSDALPVNGIDANIISDVRTGDMYMLYGSFWGGSHMLRLDPETGLAAKEGVGTCVCRKPAWLSTAVEGPYMICYPETNYYYLFVSFGSDSVLCDDDGNNYIVYHIREKRFCQDPGPSQMQIRQYFWNEERWPLVSVFTMEETGGALERLTDERLTMKAVSGLYQRISFTPAIPQSISTAVPMLLREDGYFESCSVQGSWCTEGRRILINYGLFEEEALAYAGKGFTGISGLSGKRTEFIAGKER